MEWFVEEPYPHQNAQHFTASGIGVSGDSGAAIIDESDAFVGQLWGRNKYLKKELGPRIVYFTPAQDIFDDIREQLSLSDSETPRLPQLNGGSNLPSLKLACDACLLHQEFLRYEGVPSPELDSEDMTPSEDELLTPEDIRLPDMRRNHDIESCHISFSSSVDSWEYERKMGGCGVDDVYSIKPHYTSESLDLDSDVSMNFQTEPSREEKGERPGRIKRQDYLAGS